MSYDPWYKTTLPLNALGAQLKLRVPHDVFSTIRIDEGTLLLLDHLPGAPPKTVLDMGCGYGALGLPIAARFPVARVDMVDRDLLAAAWSAKNAVDNGLNNVRAYGSLGYRDLQSEGCLYDWILCNVPARIGKPFIAHLLSAGLRLLAPLGELRIVVIRDLGPVVEELRAEHGWDLKEAGRGPRHIVYSLPSPSETASGPIEEPQDLYLRDTVEIAGLKFDRPFDIGGDDPRRLTKGLPVLLDVLPRQPRCRVLAFRCGYGVLPLIAKSRWPDADVIAVDRDLLGTTFTRRNASSLGLKIGVRESAHWPDVIQSGEFFDIIFGEISPSAGELVAKAELIAISKALAPGGDALVLILEKLEKEWLKDFARKNRLSLGRVLAREGYAVLRLTAPLREA